MRVCVSVRICVSGRSLFLCFSRRRYPTLATCDTALCICVLRLRLCYTSMDSDSSIRSPMPNIFGPGDPPSSAGIAAGSEVQGPGGGSPAVGVNLAANTSPHHTTQGNGSQAENSIVNPQANSAAQAHAPATLSPDAASMPQTPRPQQHRASPKKPTDRARRGPGG